MMFKKFKLCLVALLFCTYAFSQPTFNISGGTGNAGSTITINFNVDNFANLISAQYTINFDETVLDFNSITNITTDLAGLSAGSFGTNPSNVDNGNITFSWVESNLNPATLSNGSLMYSIVFDIIGAPCSESEITISGSPSPIEVADANEVNVGLNVNPGMFMVPGVDCGGTGGNLTFLGSTVSGDQGTTQCVAVSVQGFEEIASVQLSMNFSPLIVQFNQVQNFNLTGLNAGNFGTTNVSNGNITFVWTDPATTGVTVPDGTVIFEACFDLVGAGGQSSAFDFTNSPLVIEVNDGAGEVVPFTGSSGRININQESSGGDLSIIIGDATGMPGEVVCADVSVLGFSNMISMQHSVNWDPSKLMFSQVDGLNLPGLTSSNFGDPSAPGVNPGQLTVVWTDPNLTGTNAADNQIIYKLCFEVIEGCGSVQDINFSSTPLAMEFSDLVGLVSPVLDNGSITIDCCGGAGGSLSIELEDLDAPDCVGGNGNIFVEPCGGSEPYTWSWSNGTTNEDLLNVPAGTYTVTLTDATNATTQQTYTLPGATGLTVTPQIINDVNGCDGGINLTVTGGSGSFTYLWSNGQSTQNIINQCAGSYSVTITDSNTGCIQEFGPYSIGGSCNASEIITNVECFGQATGAINLTVNGCADPISFSWSNGATTEDLTGLFAGSYSVTLTDNNGEVFTATYVVSEPATGLTITSVVTDETTAGNDGAIDITVTGGSGNYSYLWSNGATTEDLINIPGGNYTVSVTDNSMPQCVFTHTAMVTPLTFQVEIIKMDFGNFDVTCRGECDGSATAMPLNGIAPYTFTWSTGETTQTISNLCAGTYGLTVTEATGLTYEDPAFSIFEPDQIRVSPDQENCATGPTDTNGSVSVSVTGGSDPYSYNWSTGSATNSISGVAPGDYALTVTDANGCVFVTQVYVCDQLNPRECFDSRTAITPNGDNLNEFLQIQCARDFDNTIEIYNRWGQLVYEEDNYDNSWNGVDTGGNNLLEGGYHWVLRVRLPNGTTDIHRGSVAIIRSLK